MLDKPGQILPFAMLTPPPPPTLIKKNFVLGIGNIQIMDDPLPLKGAYPLQCLSHRVAKLRYQITTF